MVKLKSPFKATTGFGLILIICLSACKSEWPSNHSEGEIVYTINYPFEDSTQLMFDMMPAEMNYYFDENHTKSEISAGMGLFKSAYITDLDKKSLKQTVKMLNKKHQSQFKKKTFEEINPAYANLEIKETGNTKTIAGFECKEVMVSLQNKKSYNIYYSTELGKPFPNLGTPYEKIPGVLMQYTIENFGLTMEFIAESVDFKEVDSAIFEIEKEYEDISAYELNQQIEAIFLSVQ